MREISVTRVDVPAVELGEGPVWDVAEQALYYVDTTGGKLHRFTPETGVNETWSIGRFVGCLAVREQGGVLLALSDGFFFMDLENEELTFVGDPRTLPERTQLNDGKVDALGRYVCGAIDLQVADPVADIFVLEPDGSMRVLDHGVVLSNGPAWSPDNRTFYHADSSVNTIYAYDYDLSGGTVAGKRSFADTTQLGGFPDGCTVDAEGGVWTAVCGGGVVARYLPNGKLDRTVDIPIKLVSSVIFGGKNLDELYVTTIGRAPVPGVPAEPGGGSLFRVTGLGISGVPEPRFAG